MIIQIKHWFRAAGLAVVLAVSGPALADPFAAPGDTALRADLQRLNDTGAINVPLTSWPMSFGDINLALKDAAAADEKAAESLARLRERTRWESNLHDWRFDFGVGIADNPRKIRSFENTPRTQGEAYVRLNWLGERFAVNLQASAVANPQDDDEFRPDGTYLGIALGNWMISAGWQERWWGPGNAGSLILSNNARPAPGIAIQRNASAAFKTKWLSWAGPWTFTSFMDLLDDEREIKDALLFGARLSFRPLRSLEIGLSRTAQWCGEDRPCGLSAFFDMLVGNDNQGVNVEPENEPGNQLAGIDIRWSLPKQIPVALYLQWIGEDGRQGTPLPGSWLRQGGIEFWGSIAGLSHSTFFEVSDTACHEGGVGNGDIKPNCAYEHHLYRTGYRYNNAALGHASDGDGLSYSLGSTLVQSSGHSWNILIRYMEINRVGAPNPRHTLSATPQEVSDIQISHSRITQFGTFRIGLGLSQTDDAASASTSSDSSAFLQWSSR